MKRLLLYLQGGWGMEKEKMRTIQYYQYLMECLLNPIEEHPEKVLSYTEYIQMNCMDAEKMLK